MTKHSIVVCKANRLGSSTVLFMVTMVLRVNSRNMVLMFQGNP